MHYFMHLVVMSDSEEEATNKGVLLLKKNMFKDRFGIHQIFSEEVLAQAEEVGNKAVNFRV